MKRRDGWTARAWLSVAAAGLIIAGITVWMAKPGSGRVLHPAAGNRSGPAGPAGETVMTIGGSVAYGWDDTKQGGGYLARAFRSLSSAGGTRYSIANRAVIGANAIQMATRYPQWLNAVKPNVVVISWGGLNDAWPRTPLSRYQAEISREIALALQIHAVVLVVTPPVTRATYTRYVLQEPMYLQAETAVARSFHSPNVQVFDVFDQMKAYLRAHHQTYKPYMADGWHPNSAGHILAGRLLFQDLVRWLRSQKQRKIEFVPTGGGGGPAGAGPSTSVAGPG